MNEPTRVLVAALTCLALALASCSDSGSDADASADAPGPTTTSSAATTRAPDSRSAASTTVATTAAPTTAAPTTLPATTLPATTVRPAPDVTTTAGPPRTTVPPPPPPAPPPPPTSQPAPPPNSPGRFVTMPVGSALPSDATCAASVRPAAEVRPDNATANATRGTGGNTVYPRVTGNFTGTTDEILQWVACKWGIDEDLVRAQIAKESYWHMSTVGDNGESFGLGQVRVGYHDSAFVNDNAKRSTAYNVDYTYAVWRDCYEGRLGWLNSVERGGTYAAGDAEGCLGVWFTGRWRVPAAETYIADVKENFRRRIWTDAGFIAHRT